MTRKLFFEAIFKMLLGIIITGLLIFLPAGTLDFFNGWLLMGLLFIPMFFAGLIMCFKNPDLLKRRLNAKETKKEQKWVVFLSAVMFIWGFIVAGLDFRFGLSNIPKSITVSAVIVFILSYILYGEVIRENTYLSRTIETRKNQTVIDTGLYSLVRHPMYLSAIFLFLSMPIILGSFWAFLIFLLFPAIISVRIHYEEAFLEENLDGYTEYKEKVKYRILPFIW